MDIILKKIGIIETPFLSVGEMPVQPLSGKGIKGRIILENEFVNGLKDIEKFTYITLLYLLHEIKEYSLTVVPFMDTEEHGIFATRSPKRPNKIGLSTVRLLSVNNNILEIEDIDMLNNTPLLDIKPYFPQFDNRRGGKAGWLDKNKKLHMKTRIISDNRFKQ